MSSIKRLPWIAGLAVLPLLAGCGSDKSASVSGPDTHVSQATQDQQYLIGPGDQLSIFVYRSPELSAEVPVRPDGRISTPLIPDIVAAGKTSTQLGEEMAGKLKEYVKDPVVTVIIRGFVGPFDRQIRVIGEATDPQAIPYREHMTVLDVMIATKGLTKYAAGNSAKIVRHNGAATQTINVRLTDLLRDGDIGENVEMQPGDTLIIPQSWF
jgi:polysaccharide export outer membrane protein